MTFKLNNENIEKFKEWKKSHECNITNIGAIGGIYTFSFIPTGIGCIKIIRCGCGKEIDLTKYEEW